MGRGVTIGGIEPASLETRRMPAVFTALGILLIIVAIPFGLMVAPLLLGVLFAWLGWKHVTAGWQTAGDGAVA